MKLSTMLCASILALAAASPNAGPAVAQRDGAQDKVVRPAKCPAGQRLNAQKRKCEGETTAIKDSESTSSGGTDTSTGGSPQSTNEVTMEQCIGSGGVWTAGVCSTAEQQCIGSGGTWTAGVCATAEQQCIGSGGAWTNGVCATAEQQCIGSGGVWTAGACSTAEQQCIGSGGTWTNGVCVKE